MQAFAFFAVCWLITLIAYCLFSSFELPFFDLYRGGGTDACGHTNKRQWVRLLDVFVLGPVGLYIGYLIYQGRAQELTPLIGILVMVYGLMTIAYNGKNYIQNAGLEK